MVAYINIQVAKSRKKTHIFFLVWKTEIPTLQNKIRSLPRTIAIYHFIFFSLMAEFGLRKTPKGKRKNSLRHINIFFVILLGVCFIFFSIFANLSSILFTQNKIDVFRKDINQLAFSFWTMDKNVSTFLLTAEDVINAYMRGENIFQTKQKEIDFCRKYVIQNKEYLKKIGFGNYEALMNLMQDLWKHQEEVYTLLGKYQSQNYLIILQNTNEKRPNG